MLAASIVGRLPIGMATLAILLFLQDTYRLVRAAGAAAALYVLGLARWRRFSVARSTAWDRAAVLAVSAGDLSWHVARARSRFAMRTDPTRLDRAGCALPRGASLPPITICMRALYPRLLPDVGLLQTAYSIDSALVETMLHHRPRRSSRFSSPSGYTGGAVLLPRPAPLSAA